MSHTIRMMIGCIMPLALIFILPSFGVGSGATLLVFMGLMFMCHLVMMGGHDHDGSHGHAGPSGGSGGHEGNSGHLRHQMETDDERS